MNKGISLLQFRYLLHTCCPEIPLRESCILESLGVSDKLPVVVYDDTFGALGARVAWTFQYVGHTNTALFEVTFSRWKELGFEIEKQINTYPKTTTT